MVDRIPRSVGDAPFELGGPTLGSSGVVFHKVGPLHQEVEDETGELQADGDEEEDDGVLLLIRQEEFGEDAAQGDDHAGRACKRGQSATLHTVPPFQTLGHEAPIASFARLSLASPSWILQDFMRSRMAMPGK